MINDSLAMPAARPFGDTLAVYALEAKYEFLRVLRTPAFALPTLLFPPMFYLLFGLLLNRGSANAAHYLFATYSVFGVMAPSLFGFGVGVAIERERGWLALKRVAPMPPGAYLLSKMTMAMLFAAIIYLVLTVIMVIHQRHAVRPGDRKRARRGPVTRGRRDGHEHADHRSAGGDAR